MTLQHTRAEWMNKWEKMQNGIKAAILGKKLIWFYFRYEVSAAATHVRKKNSVYAITLFKKYTYTVVIATELYITPRRKCACHSHNYSQKGHLHCETFVGLNSLFNSVLDINTLLQSETWADLLFMRKMYNKCHVHHTNGIREAQGKQLWQPSALLSLGTTWNIFSLQTSDF